MLQRVKYIDCQMFITIFIVYKKVIYHDCAIFTINLLIKIYVILRIDLFKIIFIFAAYLIDTYYFNPYKYEKDCTF